MWTCPRPIPTTPIFTQVNKKPRIVNRTPPKVNRAPLRENGPGLRSPRRRPMNLNRPTNQRRPRQRLPKTSRKPIQRLKAPKAPDYQVGNLDPVDYDPAPDCVEVGLSAGYAEGLSSAFARPGRLIADCRQFDGDAEDPARGRLSGLLVEAFAGLLDHPRLGDELVYQAGGPVGARDQTGDVGGASGQVFAGGKRNLGTFDGIGGLYVHACFPPPSGR